MQVKRRKEEKMAEEDEVERMKEKVEEWKMEEEDCQSYRWG